MWGWGKGEGGESCGEVGGEGSTEHKCSRWVKFFVLKLLSVQTFPAILGASFRFWPYGSAQEIPQALPTDVFPPRGHKLTTCFA